jgi:4-hydroxythreonine-4-phosphate dehydrogenase
VQLSLEGYFDGIVTGPLSKGVAFQLEKGDVGHTSIIRRLCNSFNPYMTFVGSHFSVVLVTDHLPLREVSATVTQERIFGAIRTAHELVSIQGLRGDIEVCVLGLNPHSGEGGLLGREEEELILPAIEEARRWGLPARGPSVPDVIFQEQFRKKYKIYVCQYHDQGLIPFKALHAQSDAFQATLGLPFIRTSVDHGTAKDIFGQNIAHSGSMETALRAALNWSQKAKGVLNGFKECNISRVRHPRSLQERF